MNDSWRDRFAPRQPFQPPPFPAEPPPGGAPRPGIDAAPLVDPFGGEGALSPRTPAVPPDDDDGRELDLTVYRPWIIQRVRSRPAMMLDLRRFDARSGLWSGCAVAYPCLVAIQYTGDKLLSLDFGARQFMIEGQGLDELLRHIQQGCVTAVQEYAPQLWPERPSGAMVAAIRLLTDPN